MPTTVTYKGDHRIIELTGERRTLERLLGECGEDDLSLVVDVRRLAPKHPTPSHVLLFTVTIINMESRRRRTFRGGNGNFWVDRVARELLLHRADRLAA